MKFVRLSKPGSGLSVRTPIAGDQAQRAKHRVWAAARATIESLETRRLFAVLTVNSTADNDVRDLVLTLREAINLVNGTDPLAGVTIAEAAQIDRTQPLGTNDQIKFDIPGTGVQTINVTSQLPEIEKPVTIDGYSQPGASANTLATGDNAVILIKIDGKVGGRLDGIDVGHHAGGTVIRGLAVDDFGGNGIYVNTSDSDPQDTIAGNFVGVDTDGVTAAGTTGGVFIDDGDVLIGGTTPADRNIISGNTYTGIQVYTDGTATIEGNYIGTNAAGTVALANNGDGIDLEGGSNTIGGTSGGAGNLISGNTGDGVFDEGAEAEGTQIDGNVIGTNAAGTLALGNGTNGVEISTGDVDDNITIGDAKGSVGGRNIISGNDGNGVELENSAYAGIVDNYIGLSADGNSAIGNGQDGVYISAAAAGLGGPSAGQGNVISGNGVGDPTHDDGIEVTGDTGDFFIEGNKIGTNAAGTAALGNRGDGIELEDGSGVRIGADPNRQDSPGAGNVISGNFQNGVTLSTYNSAELVANLIGVLADGTTPAANGIDGVGIYGDSSNNTIGADNAGDGNVIANNQNIGVEVTQDLFGEVTPLYNSIRFNSIYKNAGLGIDLDELVLMTNAGVTPNDPGDTDSGSNDLQNFPVLTSATVNGSSVAVAGTLNSLPNSAFNVDVYASDAADPTGYGEGKVYLGTAAVITDNYGNGSFSAAFDKVLGSNLYISATATVALGTATGDTSEFAQTITATTTTAPPATPVVTLTTPANGSSTSNNQPTFSGSASTSSGDSATVTVKIFSGNSASGTPVQTLSTTQSGGTYSVMPSTALAVGTYTAQASQSNSDGNTGTSSADTFTISRATPAISDTAQPAAATVGASIADQATVSGGYSPTGTVTFNLFNNATATGPALFTDTETLSGGTATSKGYITTATGTDYWVATYNGDTNNTSVSTGNAATPVSISTATPSIASTAQPTNVAVGASIADKATITGGFNPTGTVTFNLYNNATATGPALFTDTETLSGGTATSKGYTTTGTGTDYWVATYNGDTNNASISTGASATPVVISSQTANGSVVIDNASTNAAISGSQALGVSVYAAATVTGSGAAPTGSVTYYFYNTTTPAYGTTTPMSTQKVTISNGAVPKSSATSALPAGGYSYIAVYSGDNNYKGFTTSPATITVSKGAPAVSQTIDNAATNAPVSGSQTTGASIYDTSTVKGVSSITPTGTVTYNFYNTATPTYGTTTPVSKQTVTISGGAVPNSAATGSLAAGTYSYIAVYSGDGNYTGVTTSPATVTVGASAAVGQFLGTASANTTGSFNSLGNTYVNAFDGDANTFFDAPSPNGNYVQLDLGSAKTITKIAYAPRVSAVPGINYEARMTGGIFEASNDPNFASGVVQLYKIASTPADGITSQNVSVTGTYRYVRYVSPSGSYGDIGELQVFGPGGNPTTKTLAPLAGTASSNTSGSFNNSGNTFAKAFDGNVNSFFDAPSANGNYVQLDLGSAKTLTELAYAPRPGSFEARMIGGIFEASNSSTFASGVVKLYTVTAQPTDDLVTQMLSVSTAYRYVRYVSPSGSYDDIAELQVFGSASTAVAQSAAVPLSITNLAGASNSNMYLNTFDQKANPLWD